MDARLPVGGRGNDDQRGARQCRGGRPQRRDLQIPERRAHAAYRLGGAPREDQKIIIQGDKARISAPWQAFASVSADNGFPQESHDLPREAQLNAVFHDTRKLEWTLHNGQINDLLYAIEHGTAPLVDGLQGKRSLELITAIYKSAITRTVVPLPIQRDDPFYRTGGTNALAPVFMRSPQAWPTSAKSVPSPGKDLDRGMSS